MNFNYELEPTGDYAFIDMKSFYASCELVARNRHPLKDLLVVMSHADNTSGLVLASSPMAKKMLGISNVTRIWDLPTVEENPMVKDLIVAPPRMRYYIAENLKIQKVIRKYAADEDIMWYSIDEGVVDLTHSLNYFVPHKELSRKKKLNLVSQMIQKDILNTTGIYSTIGMSNSNPLLAKLALDNEAKHDPNMRASWNYSDVATKVWGMPEISDFWGIGHRMKENLQEMGIHSIYQLAHAAPYRLKERFGVIGLQLYHHANGIDRTKIQERYVPKSENLGNSQILPRDYRGEEMPLVIREMAEQVAIRLRRKQAKTATVSLSIGYSKNELEKGFSRQLKITPTDNTDQLTGHLLHLFDKFYDGSLVRNISVSYSRLIYHAGSQLNLFEEPEEQIKNEKLDQIMDKIRGKYGFVSIVRASSTLEHARSLDRANLVGGHAGGAGGLDGL
ncbi:Y-family DNA polymerase [Enterococcus sp. 669A]|uniref:Y-family DNA polymerase n=1 Tax=Candidatus Enterococcus moelleringii TaxID=2815325 RepID=A0ABS3L957_9ENTE|nr:Y-family DNA polymerase [Enterococcus sp. 669A]MBO1305625.1 Y-family DNA polymerase [Enterococcus sp. 669A]